MTQQGKLALMGSGEFTATMVEIHKALLKPYGEQGRAVFLDTPAGFQLNVDLISQKAVEYFDAHVQHPLAVASYKAAEAVTGRNTRSLINALKDADFILIGPGSPTYALRQWRPSPVPQLIKERLHSGACLVAASAAALVVGRFTLPVYEIYKVGEQPHWVEGLDILGLLGLNLAVVPHWNNSEGGNHDTRFCFMGEPRLAALEKQLPDDVSILGIDEHTALIIDLKQRTIEVKGRGTVTLRRKGEIRVIGQGGVHPLTLLHEAAEQKTAAKQAFSDPLTIENQDIAGDTPSLKALQFRAEQIVRDIEPGNAEAAARALLELEKRIHRRNQDPLDADAVAASRDILRKVLLAYSRKVDLLPASSQDCISPLVEEVIALRDKCRRRREWRIADELRDCLQRAKVVVTDTAEGTRWHQE